MFSPPNEQRNFVHKRILGAAIGFVTGGPVAAVGGALRGGGAQQSLPQSFAPAETAAQISARHTAHGHPRILGVRPGHLPGFVGTALTGTSLAAPAGCPIPGQRRDQFGNCSFFLGDQLGPDNTGVGGAVMGRYGAGLVPGNRVVNRAECLPGMVLGDDDVCYNKGQVPNKRRMWPAGRKPLLTGGDMNAITRAARAARRVKATTKKLQALGMLERPKTRRIKAPPVRQLGPGGPSIINVE